MNYYGALDIESDWHKYTTVGEDVDVYAEVFNYDVAGPIDYWIWNKPSSLYFSGSPVENDYDSTATFHSHTPGQYQVHATGFDYYDQDDSDWAYVYVVEVASLLPDVGTQFDDGDSDPDTKSYVVGIATSGVVTVTATPNPSIAEENLPDSWSLTGGTGSGDLERTVDMTTYGETELSCSCGDSSKTTTIYVVKGDISAFSPVPYDGDEVEVDLFVYPPSIRSYLTDVDFTATEPSGVTNYGSPDNEGITFYLRDSDITQQKIDNVRWYSTEPAHCNISAEWELEATYEIAGSPTFSTSDVPGQSPETITVYVPIGSTTGPTNYFSGVPAYSTVYDDQMELWKTTITQGTFVRDTQAEIDWASGLNDDSQFYDMITAEEAWHEDEQIENPSHAIWGTAYLAANIMNDVQANEPYTGATELLSLIESEEAFQEAKKDEMDRSYNYLDQQKCALEEEAKDEAGASHCLTMPCAYPECE